MALLRVLKEHIRQLSDELGGMAKQGGGDITEQFVHSFLRPYGLERAATPLFVAEVEKLKDVKVKAPSILAKCGAIQRPLLLPFVLLAAAEPEKPRRRHKEVRGRIGPKKFRAPQRRLEIENEPQRDVPSQ